MASALFILAAAFPAVSVALLAEPPLLAPPNFDPRDSGAGNFIRYPATVVAGSSSILGRNSRRQDSVSALGQRSGTIYTIDLTLGTPGVTVPVQLDTGASTLWVNPTCENAVNQTFCLAQPRYSSESSSTSVDLGESGTANIVRGPAGDETGYANFDYVMDFVSVGSARIENQVFGVGTETVRPAVGILGLAPDHAGWVSSWHFVIDALKSQGFTNSRAFSLDLQGLGSADGSIIFGGIDTKKYSGNLRKLPIVPAAQSPGGDTRFYVRLDGISVNQPGGAVVPVYESPIPGSGAIYEVNSGYTISALGTADFARLLAAYPSAQAVGETGLYSVDCLDAGQGGSLDFTFSGTVINVPYSDFVWHDERDGLCILGAYEDDAIAVLGANFLRSAYAVFDWDNKNVHLAQSADCGSEVVEIGSGADAVPSIVGACTVAPPSSTSSSTTVSSTTTTDSSTTTTDSSTTTTDSTTATSTDDDPDWCSDETETDTATSTSSSTTSSVETTTTDSSSTLSTTSGSGTASSTSTSITSGTDSSTTSTSTTSASSVTATATATSTDDDPDWCSDETETDTATSTSSDASSSASVDPTVTDSSTSSTSSTSGTATSTSTSTSSTTSSTSTASPTGGSSVDATLTSTSSTSTASSTGGSLVNPTVTSTASSPTTSPSSSASASALPTIAPESTTLTYTRTTTRTITSCAPEVTACHPGQVVTEVLTSLTTFCPEATTALPTTAAESTTLTYTRTTTRTITSCAPEVTACHPGQVVTEVLTSLTTFCPEATATAPSTVIVVPASTPGAPAPIGAPASSATPALATAGAAAPSGKPAGAGASTAAGAAPSDKPAAAGTATTPASGGAAAVTTQVVSWTAPGAPAASAGAQWTTTAPGGNGTAISTAKATPTPSAVTAGAGKTNMMSAIAGLVFVAGLVAVVL